MENFRPQDGIILNQDRRSLWIFPLAEHTPTALFTYRTENVDAQFVRPPVETLREVYKDFDSSGIVDEALEDLERSENPLFDSVHEVKMPVWSKGRVVLVGDSAWCLTLFSGMGATTAIMGGQQLGDAIHAHGNDVRKALEAWEQDMRPFIKKERRLVRLKSQLFVPSNRFFFVLRRMVLRLGGARLARLSQQHSTPSA